MNQLSEIVIPATIFFALTTIILLVIVYQKDKKLEELTRRFAGYLEQLDKENLRLKGKNTLKSTSFSLES